MRFDVPCTDALPFSSILLVVVGTALIFVVAVHRLALVLCTVGFVRKIWTAREGARFFRFVRHTALLHSSRKKTSPIMESRIICSTTTIGGAVMDTIFEIKIKSLEVAIDRQALRILHNGSQVFKISHIEIKSLALLVINKVKQLQESKEIQ